MSDLDSQEAVELYQKVLEDVKEAGITDEEQAVKVADAISLDLLDNLRARDDDADGKTSADGVDKLQAIAEELREERERLEWAAAQVAHLADQRRRPSIDPQPTPPDGSPPLSDVESAVSVRVKVPATDGEEARESAPVGDGPVGDASAEDGSAEDGSAEDGPADSAPSGPDGGGPGDQVVADPPSRERVSGTSSEDVDRSSGPTALVPEPLPIRREHRPRRTRVLFILVCLLLLAVVLVILLGDRAA